MKKKPNSNLLTKKRVSPKQKYHWYFWDYIYYRGERARIKNGKDKMSGFVTLVPPIILLLTLIVNIINRFCQLSNNAFIIYSFSLMSLLTIWYQRQYRKERVKAMIIHYENNKWNKKIPDILFLFIILALCAINLYILNDNTNM